MIGKGADYIAAHQSWQCDRAATIKGALGSNSGILVTTGGESWLDESMQPTWFSCPSLDILAIHAYGTGDFDQVILSPFLSSLRCFLYPAWSVDNFKVKLRHMLKGHKPAVKCYCFR